MSSSHASLFEREKAAESVISLIGHAQTAKPLDLLRLGERLREVRRRYGWTRADVQNLSQGRWTATALGTYERGERMMSAVGLVALADFYRASAADLIDAAPIDIAAPPPDELVVIDIKRLYQSGKWELLETFVSAVQQARSGPQRRLVALRTRELPRLAAVHNLPVDRFLAMLGEEGIRAGHGH